MCDSDDERPRKRRLVEEEHLNILRGLLHEELDVEIGLRERLKQTIESRLTWALVLQDALEKHFERSTSREGSSEQIVISNTFSDSALAAFKAANGPCAPLLPQSPIDTSTWISSALAEQQHTPNVPQEPVRIRHTPRNLAQTSLGPSRGPLFLRDVSSIPPLTYKLVCIDCGRSDFPRLQGMLNHCRLKHGREFGSHDECVQACAQVIQDEEEQNLVEANGSEVLGMSASLKRLFEMAVGQHSGVVLGLISDEMVSDDIGIQRYGSIENIENESTLITRTLGHHKDTPALAPFLGREPKKRQINVYDDETPIDIIQSEQGTVKFSNKLKLSSRLRFEASEYLIDQDNHADSEKDDETERRTELLSFIPKIATGIEGNSRFHMTVRIIVSDWSMCLAEDKRDGIHTHKWMVSIRTPSYGIDASTVLRKATVLCANTPIPSAFEVIGSDSVNNPPYCVLGFTDRSFLARISLEWVGSGEQNINPVTTIDHWVDISQNRTPSSRPIQGEEQVLDIELDRRTELLPKRPDSWKVDWNARTKNDVERKEGKREMGEEEKEPEDIACLKRLLARFPLTAQDYSSRKFVPPVPYFLPSTSRHLTSLVYGRRRAVEWGRARALWDAYSAIQSTMHETSTKKQESGEDSTDVKFSPEVIRPRITGAVDVYRWMASEGHLSDASELKSKPKISFKERMNGEGRPNDSIFCTLCGLPPNSHRRGRHRAKDDGDGRFKTCEIPEWASRRPLVDIEEIKALVEAQRVRSQLPETKKRNQPEGKKKEASYLEDHGHEWTNQELVKSVDPRLTLSVQRIVGALGLSCIPNSDSLSEISNSHEKYIEDQLAPHALLSVAVQVFIKKLVTSGMQALESSSRNTSSNSATSDRMLTPAHVVKGVVDASRRRTAKDIQKTILLSISRLGIEVREVPEPVTEVKMEKESQSQSSSVLVKNT